MKEQFSGSPDPPEAAERNRQSEAREEAKSCPEERGALVIYGGPTGYPTRKFRKAVERDVFAIDPVVPEYLRWSNIPITFDRHDHPDRVPNPGSNALVLPP
jgi:hypothetical protein